MNDEYTASQIDMCVCTVLVLVIALLRTPNEAEVTKNHSICVEVGISKIQGLGPDQIDMSRLLSINLGRRVGHTDIQNDYEDQRSIPHRLRV